MTAEVAVMNKLAVALAADSAVTFSTASSQKIYNAANKLFALSKREPVGVMIYGNAELMRVPWETIIKIYREQLGDKTLPRIADYFDDFIRFLDRNDALFDCEIQVEHVRRQTYAYVAMLRKHILDRVGAAVQESGSVDEQQIGAIISEVLSVERGRWEAYDFSSGLDAAHHKTLRAEYDSIFDEAIDAVLQKTPLSPEQREELRNRCADLFCRNFLARSSAGFVIAGFGTHEHFPSLLSASTDGRAAGRLKYRPTENVDVTASMGAAIVPFAQKDVVDLFIEGIDPTYETILLGYLEETFKAYPQRILETLSVKEAHKSAFLTEWHGLGDKLLDEFRTRSREHIEKQYVQPMMDIVEALPKNELASLAEALVNLTSLKRKVSLGAETVGGPVDVAVISKGDGFVWIQRKHYFRPELNHQFFSNYYRSRHPAEDPYGEGQSG